MPTLLLYHLLICDFEFTSVTLISSAVVELGFLQEIYTISEVLGLNNAMICTVINNGILEREVVVNVNVTDVTAEGIAQLHDVW